MAGSTTVPVEQAFQYPRESMRVEIMPAESCELDDPNWGRGDQRNNIGRVNARSEPPGGRPRPGPRPRASIAQPDQVDAAPTPRAPATNRRSATASYLGLVGALIAVGVLGWLFNNRAEIVLATPPPIVVPSTTVAPTTTQAPTTTTVPPTSTTAAPTTTTTTSTIPLSERSLTRIDSVSGNITPKSVTATPNGLFFAQNMMYRHSITVYDDQGSLLKTINDRVDLAAFGVRDGVVARGAPVEAAATSDGRYVYVSNYAMYGPGFGSEPDDACADSGWDNSFLYRIDTETLEIDQVIEVGAVPKFLAVSPDDQYVLVANWCSYDLSIVDTTYAREVARIDIGRHPRGVAISSDSKTAYITEMGGSDIAIVSLDEIVRPETRVIPPNSIDAVVGVWGVDLELDWLEGVGSGPRSLVLSPDDKYLYATLNGEGLVIKIDLETREVIEKVRTGDAPRSMAISEDGTALYIVNYDSDTVSKVLTETMEEVQELRTADKPIGITVDPNTSNVWVSNYSGVLQIFEDAVRSAP
jgi:YVTN family beta-propeller protein